jgi:hypothetical protein
MKFNNRIMALAVVIVVLSIPIASYYLKPNPNEQQAACSKRCEPKQGVMAPDPVLSKSFKEQSNFAPLVCKCLNISQ